MPTPNDTPGLLNALLDGIAWWPFTAGLGLFLLGMLQTEEGLERLAGRRLKRFLRHHTGHPLAAAGSGALVTALLQSSSLVGLLTLAMVGAQVIALPNALGVIIGANLGTTLSGWIVALIGFKLNLTSGALPLIALGSIGLVIASSSSRAAGAFRLITGLGLLLFGLDFMKSAVTTEGLALGDVYRPWVMLGLGVAVTAVIQSSSAAMMMTLAALHAGAITLPDGAAFVIGADLGTTSTVLLGSLKGGADKRRVGLAHVLFNLVTDLLAFLLLLPFLGRLAAGIDPLIALVAFHSAFNLIGVALFLPFLDPFARLLQRLIRAPASGLAQTLQPGLTADAPSALHALATEVTGLARRTRDYHLAVLAGDADPGDGSGQRRYREIKALEGELARFAVALQRQSLGTGESARLAALTGAARDFVHAAKSVHDAARDLATLRDALGEAERALYAEFAALGPQVLSSAERVLGEGDESLAFESLVELRARIARGHDAVHRRVYDLLRDGRLDWPAVATALNANRELYIAHADYLAAAARQMLAPERFDAFRSLPGHPVPG